MFVKTARFYDALYAFKDYAAACERLHALIRRLRPEAATLLDVACGTGVHLEYLAAHYRVEGLDINSELLAVATGRCPGVTLHHADMTDFELGSTFDVVTCLFSSIGYVRTVPGLEAAVAAMARHVAAGGLLVIEPWFTPEQYWVDRLTANFTDEPDLKIAWMYVSRRVADVALLDIHYMAGTPNGIECFTERHELGLFTDEQYRAAFGAAGMKVEYDPVGFFGRGAYIACPAAGGTATKGSASGVEGA
ncbi:hypothetical protein BH23GEM9_BH23GEM9_23430 [soil metagenome]